MVRAVLVWHCCVISVSRWCSSMQQGKHFGRKRRENEFMIIK